MFETGTLEANKIRINQEDVEKCRILVVKIFRLSSQVFPKEGMAYNLQGYANENNLEFDFWEKDVLASLTKKDGFFLSSKHKKNIPWEIRVSQYRLTNKVGRNISSRYSTKVNI